SSLLSRVAFALKNGAPCKLFPPSWGTPVPLSSRLNERRIGRCMARPFPPADITEIFSRFAAQDPDPRSELEYVNPYTLLVSVVLSAKATEKGVNKATEPLFAKVDTPEKMLALGETDLREAIKTIGLYRNNAKNVIALSKALIEEHGGKVPRNRDALE